jgi:hypothetical protein
MDTVPVRSFLLFPPLISLQASQRIRWNSLEAINQASWAGSAVFGGFIIDRYGMTFNFVTTITMQVPSFPPLSPLSSLCSVLWDHPTAVGRS